MDFAILPPEINSGRMYAGPGSGPMLAAAAAWDGLATELQSEAASYASVISGLTAGPWLGPAPSEWLGLTRATRPSRRANRAQSGSRPPRSVSGQRNGRPRRRGPYGRGARRVGCGALTCSGWSPPSRPLS